MLTVDQIASGAIPVIAPTGFSTSAVAENVLAGNQMNRRAVLMFGSTLPRSPTGHVGSGLGPGIPDGTIGLILPTEEIPAGEQRRIVDGVVFEFMDAGGTEAPAEFMFYLPAMRALCTAEVAVRNLHNVLTLRGARVRDALRWSRVIDEALIRFGERSEVVFASHHWPTWGAENVRRFLTEQRDAYRYVHDQTLRHANAGATMIESAELLAAPRSDDRQFHTRGYYGTLNHDAKAVYQHYFGWWGGVPAHLFAHPHTTSAGRYVEAMGGIDATLLAGHRAYVDGDFRWAAELFNHAVFAFPDHAKARGWLAAAYEQLGFQAESGAWRSYFLTAAQELRNGLPEDRAASLGNADFLGAVPSVLLFDAMAARYAPERLDRDPFTLGFEFPDTGERITLQVGRNALVPRSGSDQQAIAVARLNRSALDRVLLGATQPAALMLSGELTITGDASAMAAFFAALDRPQLWFNVVTP